MGRLSITGKPSGRIAPAPIKPQNARKIIRSYHNLLKERTKKAELGVSTEEIDEQLQKQHRLYQQASLSGQSNKRGGDSSKVLVSWLDGLDSKSELKYKCLEIGCLFADNAIAKSRHVDLESFVRIDLNSQSSFILKQDFMAMKVPETSMEQFNLVSCSLVLNFVSTPELRGDMLKRIRLFLRDDKDSLLFLVLPSPCVNNSRYLTNNHLKNIMRTVGFEAVQEKHTDRISYWLFRVHESTNTRISTNSKKNLNKKSELNPGVNRNNFAILLKP